MGIRESFRAVREAIMDQEASDKARATHENKKLVLSLLRKEGIHENTVEYRTIKDWDTSTADFLLNSMIRYLPEHHASTIISTCRKLPQEMLLQAPALTDQQMLITNAFMDKFSRMAFEKPSPNIKAYEDAWGYALTHEKDWHLIDPVVLVRGITRVPEIQSMVTAMKNDSHSSLTQGML